MQTPPHLTVLDVLNSGALTVLASLVAAFYKTVRARQRQHSVMWEDYLQRTKPAPHGAPKE